MMATMSDVRDAAIAAVRREISKPNATHAADRAGRGTRFTRRRIAVDEAAI